MSRDDWAHGSLLIINELLRCSNLEVEVRYTHPIKHNYLYFQQVNYISVEKYFF